MLPHLHVNRPLEKHDTKKLLAGLLSRRIYVKFLPRGKAKRLHVLLALRSLGLIVMKIARITPSKHCPSAPDVVLFEVGFQSNRPGTLRSGTDLHCLKLNAALNPCQAMSLCFLYYLTLFSAQLIIALGAKLATSENK